MSRGFISAGQLRERISIQARGSTRDAFGQDIATWTTSASNVPAYIRPLSMSERFVADQVQANIDKQIVIRYTSVVNPKSRIIWNSQEYDVKSIIDYNERRHQIALLVDRVAT